MSVTWVLERDVFADGHGRLAEAASSAGHGVISWNDIWWENGNWPSLNDQYVIFHGSLGNASRIVAELPWEP
ncbi:MAG: ATP-grasp domain-containing protein, partial [Planctomycetota bacterium]